MNKFHEILKKSIDSCKECPFLHFSTWKNLYYCQLQWFDEYKQVRPEEENFPHWCPLEIEHIQPDEPWKRK